MTEKVDVLVVGAGAVGLATALRIIESDRSLRVVVVEKESGVAAHQTGNNSGVIHSGLYYKPGSLKAKNCISGYYELIDFCESEKIPFDICGKVVVAASVDEVIQLENLYSRGVQNGLSGLKYLDPSEIKEIEPHCVGIRGLFVPQTGIVNYRVVADAYRRKIVSTGGEVLFNSRVTGIVEMTLSVRVETTAGDFEASAVVTCGGLYSDQLAKSTVKDLDLRILPFRGEYYTLAPNATHLVRNLIYPVPDPNFPFLGVHFTRMISGGIECGPNAVLAFAREGYKKFDINPRELWESVSWPGFRVVARKYWRTGLGEYHRSFVKSAFVKALQKLVPEIRSEHLEAGGSGVRAQACDVRGNLLDDFNIQASRRVIHVCNAPSPAATASLAIGRTIAERVVSTLGK